MRRQVNVKFMEPVEVCPGKERAVAIELYMSVTCSKKGECSHVGEDCVGKNLASF